MAHSFKHNGTYEIASFTKRDAKRTAAYRRGIAPVLRGYGQDDLLQFTRDKATSAVLADFRS